MVKKIVKWVVVLIAAVVAAYAVRSFFQSEEQVRYLTETVKRGNTHQTVSAAGEISPSDLITVGSQASGQIKKLYAGLGQQVKRGDLITEINSTTQVNAFSTKKPKLETYQAKLVSAEIALSGAEKKYKREATLRKKKATSKEDFENAQDALAATRANVAKLKASIKQTKTSTNTAESDLGYVRITATMDGTMVAIPVEEDQTVDAVRSTSTIIQLTDLDAILNKMQIVGGDITKMKAGQDVSFMILSELDKPIKTRLDSVGPGLTTMSLGSYTASADTTSNMIYYHARVLVPNPDDKLSINMTTQNTIEINGVENVLLVPTLTIKKRDGKSYVSVLGADNKAVEREITVGLKNSIDTEVKSGLKEGEKAAMSEMSVAEQTETAQRVMKDGGPPR